MKKEVRGKIAAGIYGAGKTNVADVRHNKYKLIT
jgi:hypothetical protein